MIYKQKKEDVSGTYATSCKTNPVDVCLDNKHVLVFDIKLDASNILNTSILSKIADIFYSIHGALEELDASKIAKDAFKDVYNISSIFSFIENNLDTSINIDVKGDNYVLKVITASTDDISNFKQIWLTINKSSDLYKLLSYHDYICKCESESVDNDDKDLFNNDPPEVTLYKNV